MRVAVIGSSGGMGSFFVRFFLAKKFEVRGSDPRKTRVRSARFRYFGSNKSGAARARFVLLATPIGSTVQAAEEILPVMDEGSTLIEMSSVKRKILPSLSRLVSGSGRRLLSIHPLFGPSMRSFERVKIAVVTSDGRADVPLAREVFPGAKLLAMQAREHDRAMALALSLNHALNLAFAETLAKYTSPSSFREFSTPSSLIQLILAEGVLSQEPSLCSYIQAENAYSAGVIATLSREVERIGEIVRTKDREKFEELFRRTRKTYHGGIKARDATEKIYRASKLMEDG